MINIDVSFVNALRRIMISEIPTVAIEKVYMWNNSSIIHDEVLAHRIGLIPLNADPRYLVKFQEEDDEPTEFNTLVFAMKVACQRKKSGEGKDADINATSKVAKESTVGSMELTAEQAAIDYARQRQQNNQNQNKPVLIDIPERPYTKHVYAKDLVWMPQGNQENVFPAVRPIHEDILFAKLRPGQLIELEAHARVGIGKDHAKYSPVSNASYRLMPNVQLVKPVYDKMADELNVYEPGVFKIVTCDEDGHYQKAVVHNPYACTMSRNFMRNSFLKDAVKITRFPNHFIFNIESVGMLPAAVILAESIRVLQNKCNCLHSLLEDYALSEKLKEEE